MEWLKIVLKVGIFHNLTASYVFLKSSMERLPIT